MALGGQLILAGAIYGGIRADIRNLYAGLGECKAATAAERARIDNLMMKGR